MTNWQPETTGKKHVLITIITTVIAVLTTAIAAIFFALGVQKNRDDE